ncbi:MAG: response regulator transcription factor [Opitutaceae bacterium]|nr:response regulator transcription factor [Opitutaceae bacterium]
MGAAEAATSATAKGGVPPRSIRVLVVEDQAMVRAGFCSLLMSEPDIQVCGSAATGREAINLVGQIQPDVAIVDYFLGGGLEGSELVAAMLDVRRGTLRVLSLSLHEEESVGERAIRAGARGFLCKDQSALHLVEAVRRLYHGGLYLSEGLLTRVSDLLTGGGGSRSPFSGLSDRELQVLRMIGTNLSLDEIARRLAISPRTVGTHRESLKRKLNVPDSHTLRLQAREWLSKGSGTLID